MARKNVKKYLNYISSAKSTTKPQYRKYVDDITTLHQDGKITKPRVEKLLRQLVSTSVRHAIKFIEDKLVAVKVPKKKVEPKKEIEATYHLNASFLLRTITYGDKSTYLTNEEADELTDYYFRTGKEDIPKKFIPYHFKLNYKDEEYASTFYGTHKTCVHLLKDKIEDEFKHDNGYFRIDVLLFKSISKVTPNHITKNIFVI